MQNFKAFLMSFASGLIIFGVLAVFLIHFTFKTVSEDRDIPSNENGNTKTDLVQANTEQDDGIQTYTVEADNAQ